jgi:dihydrofolate reductase
MKLIAIAAVTPSGVIGMNNELPWKLREDMRRFRNVTKGHAVIMGRKTRESLSQPLPDRFNIVITGEYAPHLGDAVVPSIAQAIVAACREGCEKAFIIGGGQIYKAALPICDEALITMVQAPELEGDTYFDLNQLSEMALMSSQSFPKDRDNEYVTIFQRWVR